MEEALTLCRSLSPDVVLMNVRASVRSDIAAIRLLRGGDARCCVLVYCPIEISVGTSNIVDTGANGYLGPEVGRPELVNAIRCVARGYRYFSASMIKIVSGLEPSMRLSHRQREVLSLLVRAHSNRDIGAALGLSRSAIDAQVRSLNKKLGARTRTQLAVMAITRGIESVD